MKKFIAPVAFFALSLILWNCKDDDNPGPDLTSSKISFLWDFKKSSSATFYAVISDTSGNVLKWDEIVPGTELELPYPPNPNLATITLITRASGSSGRVTILSTFTGLSSGKYTVKPTSDPEIAEKDGTFKFGIANANEDFDFMSRYLTGNYEYIDVSNTDTDLTFSYGIYDDEVNNFLIWGSTDGSGKEIKYLYTADVNDEDSVGVSKQSFADDFEVMPFHDVTYPGLPQSTNAIFIVSGITDYNETYDIDSRLFNSGNAVKIAYPEIPGLFPKYQTLMNSVSTIGNSFYQKKTATNPDLSFSNLNSTIDKVYKLSTKRIALDVSGEGEMFYIEQQFGNANDPVFYYVYAPLSSKVRMNLPQLPQELTDKIANLSNIKDEQEFELAYIDEYNMSYSGFFNFFLSNDLFGYPPNMRSKGFAIDGGSARMSAGTNNIPKRLDKKITSKIR